MNKVFNPQEVEAKIYEKWEKSGAFQPKIPIAQSGRRSLSKAKGLTKQPDNQTTKQPFTIIMPPPNANEDLHIGHVRFVTIEDILIRYHRMRGEPTLWLPGADHAGSETHYVFEKKLAEEGKSRFDFDRETLYQMIWDYSMEKRKNMESQLRALGASCDWTRNKFTLDPDIIKIVYRTFKKLYDDGLIYRGKSIVNYCPYCGTTFSQLEVETVERDDELYYLDYGPISIATTRPETIFADVAVAVSPKDKRYKGLVGKKAVVPLINKEVPIIADDLVDPKFGTGALKITPGHDAADFEIGQRHQLEALSVINLAGRMVNTPEKYLGMRPEAARVETVTDLKEAGKLKKTENIHHAVGTCYKHKKPIEPLLWEQWFLKVESLVKKSLDAMDKRQVKFVAKRFEKIARHWYENLRDWNISRQIVWGIRIPAWHCEDCGKWTITAGEKPQKCLECSSTKITQDTDTFDTWFSSGQWPFATLQTAEKGDFEYFYPTSAMETAYDIIPFWVIRMIMLGLYETGKVPFHEVLIHGLVRDKEGHKISKSKGNVIDPLIMVERYGADALRMGVVWGAKIESDISLSEENIRGQRNFANKIWNIARFILMDRTTKKSQPNADDRLILKELEATAKKVTKSLDTYRLNEAVEELYEFVWHKLADIYLEKTKTRRAEAQETLESVLKESLKLLHPFMPFVTEAVWNELGEKEALITSPWPQAS